MKPAASAANMIEQDESQYAVYCEASGHNRPLLLHNLSFAQLIDEVVVPFESDAPFFVDGAPITKDKVRRLKILAQGPSFSRSFNDLHWRMREAGDVQVKRLLGDQYHVRLEAILRETCTDVTSQAVRAFNTEIKPRLRDYMPNRKELIEAALKVFIESVKLLGGAG